MFHHGSSRGNENLIVHGFNKCPKLSKHFLDKASVSVNEMMKKPDDFVRYERDFAQTELPKCETGEQHKKSYFPPVRKDDRPFWNNYVGDARRYDNRNYDKKRDNYVPYKGRDNCAPYPPPRGEYQAWVAPVLTLKHCDYHKEKGHHTNDCHQLRRQLEAALESRKLNHLVRDVRQRGIVNQRGEAPQQAKVMMIRSLLEMMLEKKLQSDYYSEMAYQLLKLITKQVKK
uniref:Reverse transcriptase domain-containing protein n=1 Tax=Tanacetum cinerariifolium TaxID=118510 RepID=A0A6L2KNR8_TANCI|nr:reverse transcriptase domain-containing protein [Tanacetum cinerariifolium]